MTGFSRPPIIRTGTLCRDQPAILLSLLATA
jgi:hypothetical protein